MSAVNLLDLEITEQPLGCLIPFHGIDRPADLAAITASMAENGWQGGPLVLDDRNSDGHGGYLLTGSHRYQAAIDAGMESVPCVSISEIAERAGIDLDAYDDGYGTEWERVFWDIPAGIRSAYGMDL